MFENSSYHKYQHLDFIDRICIWGANEISAEMKGSSSNSAPFVFLANTCSGKFLCGKKVLRGHKFRRNVSHLGTRLISIRRSDISPHMGIDIILYHFIP